MPSNPLIALQGTSLNTAPAVNQLAQSIQIGKQNKRQEKIDEQNTELNEQKKKLIDLQISTDKFNAFDQREKQRVISSVQGAAQLKPFLDNNDIEGARNFLTSRKSRLEQAIADGIQVDTTETDEGLSLLDTDIDLLKQRVDSLANYGNEVGILGNRKPGSFSKGRSVIIRNDDGSHSMVTPVLNQSTGVIENEVTEVSGEFVSSLGETAGEQTTRVIVEAGGKETAKQDAQLEAIPEKAAIQGQQDRDQVFIQDGLDAADSLPTVLRGIELLDSIDTGGFNNAALRAKQFFGIESADEAELSSSLGKAILSQLRSTFGAQFTEREGERLERIESNFGKSTAGNKRLLQQTEQILRRAIKRAQRAAERAGDDIAAEELEEALNFKLTVEGEPEQKNDDGSVNVGEYKVRVKE